MPAEDRDFSQLEDVLAFAREFVPRVTGRTRHDLDKDRDIQLIVERLVELVGEAALRLSADTRAKYPQILWADIVGSRSYRAQLRQDRL